MSKLVKRISLSLGGILLTFLALIIAIPLFVDLNQYKPEIHQAVKDATGRELQIQGDIDLSLFPWIGAEIGAISLGNAEGFKTDEFTHIEHMAIKVRLLPLLKSEIETSAVVVDGLRLALEVDSNGISNWQDLTTPPKASSAPSTTAAGQKAPEVPASSPPAATKPALAGLIIGGIQLSNAQITYQDQRDNTQYGVDKLSLTTGQLTLGEAIDITLSAHITSNAPEFDSQVQLRTQLHPDLSEQQTHRLHNTDLKLNFDSPALATRGDLQLNSDIELNLRNEQYQLKQLKLSTQLQHPDLPAGKADISLSADISSDLQKATASIKALTLNAYQLALTGDIEAQDILKNPKFQSNLSTASFNPRELLELLAIEAPETKNSNALTQAQLALKLRGNLQALKVQDIKLTIDQTTLSGEVDLSIKDDSPTPGVRYQLAIDTLNADDYLPPATEENSSVAATPASAGAAAASTLPLETLRSLDIDGTLALQQLTISNLKIQDINTKFHANDGLLTLSPLSARLYQGKYTGDMQLDVRKDIAVVHVNESLQGIYAGPLLKDFMGEERVSGTGDIAFKLSAQSLEPDTMLKTLNGNASLALHDGAVKGFSLPHLIRKAKAKIKKQSIPEDEIANETEFSEMEATFRIKNGIVNNQDLLAKSPYVRITGKGDVNLVTHAIDYFATGVLIKSATGQGGAEVADVKGLSLPVHIRGTFEKPEFDLQLDEILKQRAKDALNKKKAELKAKLKAEADAEKKRLQQELARKKAKARAKAEAEKKRLKQEAQQQEEALKEELKNKAEQKLRDLFN